MTDKEAGGPAFPILNYLKVGEVSHSNFAAYRAAESAYKIAEAMLEARKK